MSTNRKQPVDVEDDIVLNLGSEVMKLEVDLRTGDFKRKPPRKIPKRLANISIAQLGEAYTVGQYDGEMNELREFVLLGSSTYANQQSREPNYDTRMKAAAEAQVQEQEQEDEEEEPEDGNGEVDYNTGINFSPSKEVVELDAEDWAKELDSGGEEEIVNHVTQMEDVSEGEQEIRLPKSSNARKRRSNAGVNQRYTA